MSPGRCQPSVELLCVKRAFPLFCACLPRKPQYHHWSAEGGGCELSVTKLRRGPSRRRAHLHSLLRAVTNFKHPLEIVQQMRTAAHGSPAGFLLFTCTLFSPTCSHFASPRSILILLLLSGFLALPWGSSVPSLRDAERAGWSGMRLCFVPSRKSLCCCF